MNQTGRPIHRLAAILLAAWLLMLPSCGKKAPPQAPEKQRLPAVNDLKVARGDGNLVILWALAETAKPMASRVAGFNIYRSKTPVQSDCADCPPQYEKVGQVPFGSPDKSPGYWSFTDLWQAGYVYRYRVRAYDADGNTGPISDTLRVATDNNDDQ